MKYLIYPCDWEIDDNWPQSGNKYKYNCKDKATLDLIASEKQVYIIWWWHNRQYHNFYDVVKGTFYRGDYGVVKFTGEMLPNSKNYKKYKKKGWTSVWGDDWLPSTSWGDFHECLGLEFNEHTKLTCLVFDNEQEALECLDKWYYFLENKGQKENAKHNKFYQDQIDELEKEVHKNAEDFKSGELTYEEFHSIQYQLFQKIEKLKKELI